MANLSRNFLFRPKVKAANIALKTSLINNRKKIMPLAKQQ
jgi:hypothetical protein